MRTAIVAAALMVTLSVAACGDDDGDKGKVVEGTGYEVTVPEGWEDESEAGEEFEAGGLSPDLVLIGDREEGFAANVNVIRTQGAGVGLDAQVRAERKLLERGRIPGSDIDVKPANGLTPVERTTLSDEPARAYEFELRREDQTLQLRQVIAIRDGDVYVVTLTAHPDRFDDELDAFASILDSWQWE